MSIYILDLNPLLVSPVGGRRGGGGEPSAWGRGLGPGEELGVLLAHGVGPGEPAPGGVAVSHRRVSGVKCDEHIFRAGYFHLPLTPSLIGFPGSPGRGTPIVAPCFWSCSRVRVRLLT